MTIEDGAAAELPASPPERVVSVAPAGGALGLSGAEPGAIPGSPLPPELMKDADFLEILRRRDIGGLYRELNSRGHSRRVIAGWVGGGKSEISSIIANRVVRLYDTLARIADRLRIPPGLMGLGYVDLDLEGIAARDSSLYTDFTEATTRQFQAASLARIAEATPPPQTLARVVPVDHQGRSIQWRSSEQGSSDVYPVMVGGAWTADQIRELRYAMRRSTEEFAARLHTKPRTVSTWELGTVTQPRAASQAALDNCLRLLEPDARVRFMHALTQTERLVIEDQETLPDDSEAPDPTARVAAAIGATSVSEIQEPPPDVTLPDGFLADPDLLDILRTQDIGRLFASLQRCGIPQRRIADWTGQLQSEISEAIGGKKRHQYAILTRIADGLGIPRGLMGLAYFSPGSESVSASEAGEYEQFAQHILQARIVIAVRERVAAAEAQALASVLHPIPDHQGRGLQWVLPAHGAKEPYLTLVGGLWSSAQIQALRQAMGMSVKDFASHIGVGSRVVNIWRRAGALVQPKYYAQSALDYCLRTLKPDARERFMQAMPLIEQSPHSTGSAP